MKKLILARTKRKSFGKFIREELKNSVFEKQDDKVLFEYQFLDSEKVEQFDQKMLKEIVKTRDYEKLPDPRDCLIWINFKLVSYQSLSTQNVFSFDMKPKIRLKKEFLETSKKLKKLEKNKKFRNTNLRSYSTQIKKTKRSTNQIKNKLFLLMMDIKGKNKFKSEKVRKIRKYDQFENSESKKVSNGFRKFGLNRKIHFFKDRPVSAKIQTEKIEQYKGDFEQEENIFDCFDFGNRKATLVEVLGRLQKKAEVDFPRSIVIDEAPSRKNLNSKPSHKKRTKVEKYLDSPNIRIGKKGEEKQQSGKLRSTFFQSKIVRRKNAQDISPRRVVISFNKSKSHTKKQNQTEKTNRDFRLKIGHSLEMRRKRRTKVSHVSHARMNRKGREKMK